VLRQLSIEDLVSRLVQLNSSDLHLKVGAPPATRVRGLLDYLEGYEVLRPVDTEELPKGIIPKKLVEEFEEDGEADFSYAVQGVGRFRVNAFRQRGSFSHVMRFIPFGVPRFEDLGLPGVIGTLAREERGIILVTGTTGSGKSTTLASMLDLVNRTVPKHIVTIEDPIVFLHRDGWSLAY
jgi:twitching motility protein PilT